jgi:hypothetical protein
MCSRLPFPKWLSVDGEAGLILFFMTAPGETPEASAWPKGRRWPHGSFFNFRTEPDRQHRPPKLPAAQRGHSDICDQPIGCGKRVFLIQIEGLNENRMLEIGHVSCIDWGEPDAFDDAS